MKLMIVGTWQWPIYEAAFAHGLSSCGIEVIPCDVGQFFRGMAGRYRMAAPPLDILRWKLNDYVLTLAAHKEPDWVLFWRPTHIHPKTLIHLFSLGIKTASYNNDDPFGPKAHSKAPWHHHLLWHFYERSLPFFDCNFFYRQINCDEALKLGVKHADILLPYFIPKKDHPIELSSAEKKKFEADIVFVGHYEPDGREISIRALLEAGINLKIWGGHYWSPEVLGDMYERLAPIKLAEDDDYSKAICGAKVCLAFLSKLNRDTYTRRCFEIPACGRVMLAERTDDLTQMFKEDKEACFFSSNEELVQKALWLLENPKERERIAQAGMRRVWTDGHDVVSRARQLINKLQF